MAKVAPEQWKRKRGRPKKDNSVLPGQTSFVNAQKDESVNQKLELITKDNIKDLDGLKKAVKEYKFLDNEIKSELKELTQAVQELERPVMERVNDMRIKAADLLDNITGYSKSHAEDLFHAVPGIGKLLDLGEFEISIRNKESIVIKPKTPAVLEGVESDINHGS